MNTIKRFRLPGFTLTARELTDAERAANRDPGRDYIAIDISAKGDGAITLCVGSPVCGEWDENRAARAAISFANAPWCADDPGERAWMEAHGEELTNQAYCHRVLGAELREGC
jgi:hypothetical protein